MSLRPRRLLYTLVGFPKVGTTSLHQYFKCGGLKSAHYTCSGDEEEDLLGDNQEKCCGSKIRDNIAAKQSAFLGEGHSQKHS